MKGRVEGLALCLPGRIVESSPASSLVVTREGLFGDRHFGPTLIAGARQKGVPKGTVLPNTRQVSLVSREENAAIAQALKLDGLDFTWLAANVEVCGLDDLTGIPAGSRLIFEEGVVLRVEGENEPCRKVGRVIAARTGAAVESAFVKAARRRRGLVAWVEVPGALRVGESVRVSAG
jgi:hypothetical protein